MSELPLGWADVPLGSLLNFKYGKALPDKERSGKGFPVYGSNGVVGWHSHALTTGTTIVIGRKGSVGALQFSNTPCSPIDTTYYIDEAPGHQFRFWFYRLKSLGLASLNKSTAIPGLSRGDAYQIVVALPPLAEQKRIADKLDTVLTRVDAVNTRLARVAPLLKRFRQSVLAAATSGRLTEDWHLQKSGVRTDGLWSVPDGWKWVRAEELCEFITKGTTPPKEAMFEGEGEIPYIKVYNLKFDGTLDFTIAPTYITKRVHEGDLKRSRCLPNDVLMNIVGPPLGKVSVVPDSFAEWNINQAIARFRPVGVQPAYLSICLRTPALIAHAVSRAKATAGQFNLTLEICRDLPIALPNADEQTEIVRRVETLFAFADRLEARLAQAQTAATRLTPALLAKAFRGELVPQDPNDEPAAQLLRRLQAERASAPKASAGRGRKAVVQSEG